MTIVPPLSPRQRSRLSAGLTLALIVFNFTAVVIAGLAIQAGANQGLQTPAERHAESLQQFDDMAATGRPDSLWRVMVNYQRLNYELEYRNDPAQQQKLEAFLLAHQTPGLVLRMLGLFAVFGLVGLLSLGCGIYGIVRLVHGPPLKRRWQNWQQGVVSPLPIWTLVAAVVLLFGALIAAGSLPQARSLFGHLAIWEAGQAVLLLGLLLTARAQVDLQPAVDFGFRRQPARGMLTGLKYYFAWLPLIWVSALVGKLGYSVVDAAAGHPEQSSGMTIEELISPTNAGWGPVVLMIIAVGLAPLFEELFFRGFLYGALRRWLSAPAAMVLSGALFAVVHPMPNHLPIFLLGMLLAYIYEKTGNLGAAMVIHFTHNLMTTLLMGLLFL